MADHSAQNLYAHLISRMPLTRSQFLPGQYGLFLLSEGVNEAQLRPVAEEAGVQPERVDTAFGNGYYFKQRIPKTRRNPDAQKPIDPRAYLAANDEAKVMATLMPEQLWSQAAGAGSEWAMWELQRRGQTVPWVRTNPKATFDKGTCGICYGSMYHGDDVLLIPVEIYGETVERYVHEECGKKHLGVRSMPYEDLKRMEKAGDINAFRELDRRRNARNNPIGHLRAKTNSDYPCDVCLRKFHFNDLKYTDQAGGVYACPTCLRKLSTAVYGRRNPRQVTGPDACSRCGGTGYAGPHGDTCSRCEGSGVDAQQRCEGGCGKTVRESQGMCRPCSNREDEENGIKRDAFGYAIRRNPSRPTRENILETVAAAIRSIKEDPQPMDRYCSVQALIAALVTSPSLGPDGWTSEDYGSVSTSLSEFFKLVFNKEPPPVRKPVKHMPSAVSREKGGVIQFTPKKGKDNPRLADFINDGRGIRAKDLTIQGSGPRGGYTQRERALVPTSMFLKPSTRSWPAGDKAHAFIALQYMTRGFGSHAEYPALIQRLAELWPVDENVDVWADYSTKKKKIDKMCGCVMPSVDQLRSR